MAEKYCDHGLYPSYAAVPTWGVAQEGDGKAIGASTSAIGSVSFAQAHTTGTVGIFGASVSYMHGASADAEANNLASAINASTAVVASTFAPGTPQLRNLVYARGPSAGAPAGTCQIMSRAGSTDLNDSGGNTTITKAGHDGTQPTLTQFSGGASGAWGYLYNTSNIWPSSTVPPLYGIWGSSTGHLLAGVQSPGDIVHIRAGKTITHSAASHLTLTPPAIGTLGLPVTHLVDDGSVWTADAPNPRLRLQHTMAGGYQWTLSLTGVSALIIRGAKYGVDDYNLMLEETGSSSMMRIVAGAKSFQMENFSLGATGGGSCYLDLSVSVPAGANRNIVFRNFLLQHSLSTYFLTTGSYNPNCELQNFTISNGSAIVLNNGVFLGSTGYLAAILASSGSFKNFIVGSKLLQGTIAGTSFWGNHWQFVDCDFANVTDRGPVITGVTSTPYAQFVAAYSKYGNRDYQIETGLGMVSWISNGGYPRLSALLPDGSTKWSWRIAPTTDANGPNAISPLTTPRLNKVNTLATAARTLRVQCAISDTLAWNKSHVSILARYRDASGVDVVLDSWDATGASLAASSVTWDQESGGKPSYTFGGLLTHNKYQLEVSTPPGHDLPLGAEVDLFFRVHANRVNTTQFLFVDPDIEIV